MDFRVKAEAAAKHLEKILELLRFHEENPFKIKAFQKGIEVLETFPEAFETFPAKIPGIGAGLSAILTEFFESGTSTALRELEQKTPVGYLVLVQVPGLGPKKAKVLVETLGIQSLSELEYACLENRLVDLSGFGQKTQDKLLAAVRVQIQHQGKVLLPDAEEAARQSFEQLKLAHPNARFELVGGLARQSEVVDKIEWLTDLQVKQVSQKAIHGLPIEFHHADLINWGSEKVRLSSSSQFWESLPTEVQSMPTATEEDFFNKLGKSVPAEHREWVLADCRSTADLVHDVKGVFHVHTTASDGKDSLRTMVQGALDRGYQYIGISDHSEQAFYAKGLKRQELLDQIKSIHELQKDFPSIRIFAGVESDILKDGSLDYDDEALNACDFVIASVHSRFEMDEQAMTDRVVRAISHPKTKFFGHSTGRILLGRQGYALNWDRVLEACAKYGVAVELNAHPSRLDLDWRLGPKLRQYGVSTSIHPDAHELSGLDHVKYGVVMARKAGFSALEVINTKSVKEVEKWLSPTTTQFHTS